MTFCVRFYKERQKFSAAHFTLLDGGEVERLHGHNYRVSVRLYADALQDGLALPFDRTKATIDRLCGAWDEYVLLPATSPFVALTQNEGQCEVRVTTEHCRKYYSFPADEVVCLPVDNISSENLALLFCRNLERALQEQEIAVVSLEIAVAESSGQEVSCRLTRDPNTDLPRLPMTKKGWPQSKG